MPHFPSLVSPAELAPHLDDPDVLIVDASVNLTRDGEGQPYRITSGRAGYDAAHIPGAVFADLISVFSDPDGSLMFQLPTIAQFEAAAGALGIRPGVSVVAYVQELPTFAPRLWWLLRYFGFDAVSVLDGGLRAWQAAGLPVTDAVTPPRAPSSFVASPREHLLARREEVERVTQGTHVACLINSLSPAEFRGEGVPADERGGSIPGSVNVPWYANVERDSGFYRPATELAEAYARAGVTKDQPVITYCGGGIAASMDAFALSLAGYDNVKVYDGSLAEWVADPSLPLVRVS